MKTLTIIAALAFATVARAGNVTLSWADNSDNEQGFSMEGRKPDGAWEEVARTAADVTKLQVDTETHDAWRVRAFNAWGFSGYSNELEKNLPADPGDTLRIDSVTETTTTKTEETRTKTTVYR